ncbi:polysaccharide deacetylase family protein [Bacillus salinus]|uniref:polysaccharide deacetylase family protein n=1 Tax=Bacillus sp. HMF5848 TaxID=2495421 RepID=UPI0021ADCD11|nr:polysaccharide deacetylase family protein [Bacillus sp. HMF5848]
MKHFFYLLAVVLMLSVVPVPAEAGESSLAEAPIFIDGKPYNSKFIMIEGHLLVPALFFKKTGAQVDWDNQYRSVVLKARDTMFALPIGKRYSDDFNRATGTWERGKLAAVPIELAGEPFIPLVETAKKLGMDVKYDRIIDRTFITTHIEYKPNEITVANTSEKYVALTFDDGPDDFYTPRILSILKEKGVPATFFVIGRNVSRYPNITKQMVSEGHSVANHTWSHPDLRYTWSADVKKEILDTQDIIFKTIGRKSDLFRPPYGFYTKADLAILSEIGMRNIKWSVDTLDWSGLTADMILDIVRRDITPGGIILQHNNSANRNLEGTIEALPIIIDELKKQGYMFVTLQTLLDRQK